MIRVVGRVADHCIVTVSVIIHVGEDGEGVGKGGLAKLFIDGEQVAEGRVDKTQPAVFSADETADVGKDDATQVADKVFKDVRDSEFTGYVNNVTISIPN